MASVEEESEDFPDESLTGSLANLKLEDGSEGVITLNGDTFQKASLLDKYYGPPVHLPASETEGYYCIFVNLFNSSKLLK